MQAVGRQPSPALRAPDGGRFTTSEQTTLYRLVLQVVHRVITCHLLIQASFKADEADSGAVTLIQRFGSAANLNIHLHCLLLDGVYRRSADGAPEFVEVTAPTDEALHTVLLKIIARFWLSGQGGYGLQTAPALATLAAALILRQPVLGPLASLAQAIEPQRFTRAA